MQGRSTAVAAEANVSAATANSTYALMISAVAACAGLLFGYDIAVINGALLLLQREFTLSPTQTEWAASSLLAGCVIGAAGGGWLSDRWGRKYILIACALLFAISSIAAALPRNVTEFAFARVLGGVAIGVSSLLAPLYIAEIAPAAQRGRLVSLQQLTIVSGILLAYFINWILSFQGADAWRGMFAAAALPSLVFFLAMLTAPESPRWLVQRNRRDDALRVLARVNGQEQGAAELSEIERMVAEESGTLSELWKPGLRKALLLGLALAVLQQWTGINTVLFYGSILLKQYTGGTSDTAAIGANVWIGVVNFVATLVAMAVIDRWGRRKLLISSAAGLGLGLLAMAAAFAGGAPNAALVVPLMLCCAGAFAVGLGPGVWVYLSEIFPNRIRGRAMGLATTALWAACCVLTFTFLSIANRVGASGAFLLYAMLCGVTIVVVLKAPETRNRSLEQIESLWRPHQ